MNLITRLIGLNIFIVIFFGTLLLGGKLDIYADIPSIVMVVGLIVGGVLMCFPFNQIVDALRAALVPHPNPCSAWQRQQRIAVFARLYQLAWGGGLVAALIGLIAMLSDLSDPASIGSGMAAALLAPAYGALLAEFIFNPMQQIVMNQRPTDDPDAPDDAQGKTRPSPVVPGGQTAMLKGVAMIAIIVTMFMVPIVSFSEIKKEDALSPEVEATYLRYLYGDDAPQSKAVSPRMRTRDDEVEEGLSLIERLEQSPPVNRTGVTPRVSDE